MKKQKIIVFLLVLFLMFCNGKSIYAVKPNLPGLPGNQCTHATYDTSETNKYHYIYCDECGLCKERHTLSFSKYNSTYHKASCSCGYTTYKSHKTSVYQITNGETINGIVYEGNTMLDKYHKTKCTICSQVTGVEKHKWTGGNTSAHQCSSCGKVHSKKDDATKGLHYFVIEEIRNAGEVTPCVVCGKYLTLKYSTESILDELPKKEEYTMVGNPDPMKEMTLDKDQIIEVNFMPLNEKGELIPIDDFFLRVREYKHGNYYSHYAKLLEKELSKITDRVQYLEDSQMLEYIASELSAMVALGEYNEAKKQEILDKVNNLVEENPNLNYSDISAIINVVSKLGDFALHSIDNPILDWFEEDLAIKNTWLPGDIHTLRWEFEGTMTNSTGRKFIIYFSELPDNRYEILRSPLLTYGVDFSTFAYSLGGLVDLMHATLFVKGDPISEPPADILAYISIAYRDTNGKVIYTKAGNIATPLDTVISNVVYSGTTSKNVTRNISAAMEWTQLSGYRYKGYLIKYGNSSGGMYSVYNKPSEMTVTTTSKVSVTSSFSTSGLRNKFSILF